MKVKKETKRHLIQARVTTEQFQEIITKSFLYCNGDISKFVRMACVEYKSTKKKPTKKIVGQTAQHCAIPTKN